MTVLDVPASTGAVAFPVQLSGPPIQLPEICTGPLLPFTVSGPVIMLSIVATSPPLPDTSTGPSKVSGPHGDPAGPPRVTGPVVPVMETRPVTVLEQIRIPVAPVEVRGPLTVAPIRASAPPGCTVTAPLTVPPSTHVLPVTVSDPWWLPLIVVEQA